MKLIREEFVDTKFIIEEKLGKKKNILLKVFFFNQN